MNEAVAPLAGAYDLKPALAKIGTALGAGRAEVRLNHARMAARLQARDFDVTLSSELAKAKDQAAVDQLVTDANKFATKASADLKKQLDSIIEEASLTPGLTDRIPEAKAYSDTIVKEQDAAFAELQATAELSAAGAQARVSIEAIKNRLEAALKGAEDAEQVDKILKEAE